MSEEGRERAGRVYWRSNLRLLTVLLAIWFACSFGLGILLVEPLNRIQVGGFPLGFWFAQRFSRCWVVRFSISLLFGQL